MKASRFYFGIKGHVLCFDRESGAELWRTTLEGKQFVNVVLDQDALLAYSHGRLWRLDPESGRILWEQKLRDLGWGLGGHLGSFALENGPANPQQITQAQEAMNRTAAAGAAAAGGAAAASAGGAA